MNGEQAPILLSEVNVTAIREKLNSWGINAVAFDLDDTLIDTGNVFKAALLDISGLLIFGNNWTGQDSQLERAIEFEKWVMRGNIQEIRAEFGVNPVVLRVATILAAKERGLQEQHNHVILALQRIGQIYDRDVPEVFDGAHGVVDLINATSRRTILITHAQEEWTRRKVTRTGFAGKFETIRCLSVYRSKSSQQEQTIRELGIDPLNLLVVGDNFSADLQDLVELGATGVLIGSHRSYSGEAALRRLPLDSFIRINEINELPQAILNN